MFMSGLTPSDFVNEQPPSRPVATQPSERVPAAVRALSPEEQMLRSSTVGSYLAHLNSDSTIAANASSYSNILLPDTTSPALYARADLVTNWYKRNLRIFAKLARATEKPDNRVLLVIGAGHIHILSDLALTSTYYCLVSPLGYLAGTR